MEESEHPPSEEPMSDVLDSNLTGCCNLLGLEGVTGSYLPESILAPDPVWTEGLPIPLDPFPEAITNSPNGDYAPVQRSGLLYEDTLELSQPLKLDQVVQLGYLEPSEPLEHNGNVQPESLGQDDDKWSGSLEQDRVEPLEQNQMTWSEPLEQEHAQVQQSKSLEQNRVKLSQPLEQDRVKPPESLEQIPVTCSEALERDQMEQLESLEQNQVKLSPPLELGQVKPPEPLELGQVKPPEPLELGQVKPPEPLELGQEEPQESMERTEPLEQEKLQPLESEKGSPSNMDLEDTSKDDMGEVMMSSPEVPFPTEFEKYYRVVEVNPEDFDGWTYLLQYVEQENHMGAARKAFDSFLSRYPYCYGYWKKYAEMERRLSSTQMADEVFRRGLQAIPLSVDLWLHFVGFLRESAEAGDGDAERRMREVYEHAVLAAGTDFRSDRLWESYITWETELGNLANVTAIYDRLLTIPTQLYNHHFQRFREHVQNNLPKNFLSLEEFVELRKKLASMDGLSGEEVTPAEDISPGNEDLTDPAKRVTEIENMRHSVLESRQEVFNLNETEVSKRWTFEEGIKRPYFHVKPLERTQLNVWREYLDFELENGTPERVVVLFERCLIACALYEEFWIKYAKYLESYSVKGVRHVYQKACLTHLPRKTTVHLLWAAFEEQQGCIEEARRILKNLDQVVPGLAVVRLRRVNLERRHGDLEEAESLLQDAIENGKSVSDSSFYSIKLARMLFKMQKSLQRARKVLLEAIEKDKTNPKLYLNLLELEYSGELVENEEQILSCFDRALSSPMSLQARLTFSQRKVEFLEDFGSDVNKLMASYEEHQKLLKVHDSIKRKAENGSQEPEPKRQCTEDASLATGHMMGQMMPDMHTSHAAYNYNWYQHYNYQNPWGYGHYYPPPST